MTANDTEFELTVREVPLRDRETDEITTGWQVNSSNMPRPCQDESAAEALRILADCLEAAPDRRVAVSIEELAGETNASEV